jgi:hypothetical protein
MGDTPGRTVSREKQYEYVTNQIVRSGQYSRQAFRHYVQVYSAIVGGSIWLSMDARITGQLRETYISAVRIVAGAEQYTLMGKAAAGNWSGLSRDLYRATERIRDSLNRFRLRLVGAMSAPAWKKGPPR